MRVCVCVCVCVMKQRVLTHLPITQISPAPLLDVQCLDETVDKRKDAANCDPITVRVR